MGVMDHWRQLDIVSPSELEQISVTMIGAGGIGSPTALALSKMGVENITIYDNDKVEVHNLPNQMFRIDDIGKTKVKGTGDICRDFAGIDIEEKCEPFKDQMVKGVVISGVDSMNSRKDIWKKIKYNFSVPLYIDARMGAEVCCIYTVKPCDPTDVAKYEKTLYSDAEASEEKCTAKAIIYNTLSIAGLISNQVKKFAKGQGFPYEIAFDLNNLILVVN